MNIYAISLRHELKEKNTDHNIYFLTVIQFWVVPTGFGNQVIAKADDTIKGVNTGKVFFIFQGEYVHYVW